ncbi:MAG: putative metal-binding motif-containing protein [Myxococcota bacterium]
MLVLPLLLAACTAKGPGETGAPLDTGDDTARATDTADTADTPDTAPVDRDADGTPADRDCDDLDPAVFPGAPEAWNGSDDDCDGVADADGAWTGSLRVDADAVYEGRPYRFTLDCPVSGTRADGAFPWAATCTPDPADEDAQRLLGATLTLTPDDDAVAADRWDGTVVFTSSNGWDSDGEGTITWSSFDAAEVSAEMAGVSLTARAGGGITRGAAARPADVAVSARPGGR